MKDDLRIPVQSTERSDLPGAGRIVGVLIRKEIGARFSSLWFWLVASAICLVAANFGGGFQGAFTTETVLISSDPLLVPNAMVLIFAALVIGLRLSTALSWEREHRTLEVLLVGPVGHRELVIAKFLADASTIVAMFLIYGVYLLLGQPLGAGVLSFQDLIGLWQAVPLVLPVLAFGLLISACFSTVRASVICFLVLLGFFALLEALILWLSVQLPQDMSLTALYLRRGFEFVDPILDWMSPLAFLSDLVGLNDGRITGFEKIAALGMSVAFLAIATVIGKFRRAVS